MRACILYKVKDPSEIIEQ